MTKRKLDKMTGDAGMAYGRLAGDVAREILVVARRENISKAELAARIGRDKGFVTRVLSGAHNLQLRTIAAMLGGMGYVLDIKAKAVRAPAAERRNAPSVAPIVMMGTSPAEVMARPGDQVDIKLISA